MKAAATPDWLEDDHLNEVLFCEAFLKDHPLQSVNGRFYTPEGILTNEHLLKKQIYNLLRHHVTAHLSRTINDLVEILRIQCCCQEFPLETDRIHLANGTLYLDGQFTPQKDFCQNRLPVSYNAKAEKPTVWLAFLEDLLEKEDAVILQEYMGYCLIPSTRAQKMLVILGNGGEGKSRVGLILKKLLGTGALMESIQKIETNRFARADLEGKLLMVDDDMDMNALPKTSNLKTIVTAESPIDLERKGSQSYQAQLYVRFLCLGNGALTALNDSSNGFYRRQLILYTKDLPKDRINDPYLIDKMSAELEGIFLWCLEGLHRLLRNHYQFSISSRVRETSEIIQCNANSFEAFMESTGYIELHADYESSSMEIYKVYKQFCADNAYHPISSRQLSVDLTKYSGRYNLESTNNIILPGGRRVRGFVGIQCVLHRYVL